MSKKVIRDREHKERMENYGRAWERIVAITESRGKKGPKIIVDYYKYLSTKTAKEYEIFKKEGREEDEKSDSMHMRHKEI